MISDSDALLRHEHLKMSENLIEFFYEYEWNLIEDVWELSWIFMLI